MSKLLKLDEWIENNDYNVVDIPIFKWLNNYIYFGIVVTYIFLVSILIFYQNIILILLAIYYSIFVIFLITSDTEPQKIEITDKLRLKYIDDYEYYIQTNIKLKEDLKKLKKYN